ncbi:SAM-dependent methyltransferase [Streptacidiphilus sp. BW17]|uniref:SAM-dependent methyltransferase n=1 Tax=Streptacidiphilus sp. BW17 TaxID=3156274 RepID=UPI003519698A
MDVSIPSAARMYDWLLGGANNYLADRLACEDLLKTAPSTRELALNNRAFLRRVVHTIAQDFGIRQFIDHGSGLPTQDNVHQVAQRVDPSSKVVYVDNDPIVLAHGRALLDENDNIAIIREDMADTEAVLDHPRLNQLIDFTQPVAALFVSVLHCIPDHRDPAAMIRKTAQRLAPGSVMVICQLVSEDPAIRKAVTDLMAEQTHGNWGRVRTQEEVQAYFEGLDIQLPGLVDVTYWRPDSEVVPRQKSHEWIEYGGLARLG